MAFLFTAVSFQKFKEKTQDRGSKGKSRKNTGITEQGIILTKIICIHHLPPLEYTSLV